jgi:poly(3-hydroxybutyrate) depolymerase
MPLWIMAPGRGEDAEAIFRMSGVIHFAEMYKFVVVGVEGMEDKLNVGAHGGDITTLPDDVVYAQNVLREVSQKIRIDYGRIRCVGYSRGARFCSRLLSELSSFISAAAMVGGVRFPLRNNATRPVPLIAFHGTQDPVNPYQGNGHWYWHSSVESVIRKWARFNRCRRRLWKALNTSIAQSQHTSCSEEADVVLVRITGGGHTWPGSSFHFVQSLGKVTKEIDATRMIVDFFGDHTQKLRCHTAMAGERCHEAVREAMATFDAVGGNEHWGLTKDSQPEEYQAMVHRYFHADCPEPCPSKGMVV